MTLLTLSYKTLKMRAILGPLVYILIRPIGRRAIKKIESAKVSKVSCHFFKTALVTDQISPGESQIVSYKLIINYSLVIR